MTRREREILKASVSWTDKTLTVKEEKAFQAGARWADCNPNQQMVEQMRCTLKDVHKMLNEMLEDYDDARLGIVYRVLDSVIEDLELLIDDEE